MAEDKPAQREGEELEEQEIEGMPNEIINKAGPLTAGEWEIVERHTIEGERLLHRVGGLLGEIGRVVRSCHERWDGKGYPDGLGGEQIP